MNELKDAIKRFEFKLKNVDEEMESLQKKRNILVEMVDKNRRELRAWMLY